MAREARFWAPTLPKKGRVGQPKLGELEEDVDGRHGVHGLSVAHGGLETHAFGGANSGFVESMAEPANHSQNFYFPGNSKVNLEEHFAFDLQAASLLGINRVGFGSDFSGDEFALGRIRMTGRSGRSGSASHVAETAGVHTTSGAFAGRVGGDTVTESRAGDDRNGTLAAATAVALSRTRGQIKGADLGQFAVLGCLRIGHDAAGIAESAGLNFLRRQS